MPVPSHDFHIATRAAVLAGLIAVALLAVGRAEAADATTMKPVADTAAGLDAKTMAPPVAEKPTAPSVKPPPAKPMPRQADGSGGGKMPQVGGRYKKVRTPPRPLPLAAGPAGIPPVPPKDGSDPAIGAKK